MKHFISLCLFGMISSQAFCADNDKFINLEEGLYACIVTDFGDIIIQLFETKAPKTVKNFVDLASGKKEWIDPLTNKKVKKRFYDGLIFHRVIEDFMIQSGCPKSNGTGGPGYEFEDEVSRDLMFNSDGLLAMANRGRNTNGSQFFITLKPTSWLNMKHTIFGKVVDGMKTVTAISKVSKDNTDRPIEPVYIRKLLIKRVK